jgi:hypothetical protein
LEDSALQEKHFWNLLIPCIQTTINVLIFLLEKYFQGKKKIDASIRILPLNPSLNDNPTKFLEKKLLSLRRKGLSDNSTQVP